MAFNSVKEFLEALASGKKIKDIGTGIVFSLVGDSLRVNGPSNPGLHLYQPYDILNFSNFKLFEEDKSIKLYQVYFRRPDCSPSWSFNLFKTKESFLANVNLGESDFEFIHLVPITIPHEAFIK